MAESRIKIRASAKEMWIHYKEHYDKPLFYIEDYASAYDGIEHYHGNKNEKIIFTALIKHQEIGERTIERSQPYTLSSLRKTLNKKVLETEEYIQYLKGSITEYCNDKGCIPIYWDYRDYVSKDTIQEYINDIILMNRDIMPLENKICDKLVELNIDYVITVENEFRETLIINAPNQEIKSYIEDIEYSDLFEDLEQCGYNGVDMNIDDLLENTSVYVNILFGTEKERDFDMGSIVTAYGNDYQIPFINWNMEGEEDYLDNALTYLIHQQGYKVDEFYNRTLAARLDKINKDSNFMLGLSNDISNNSSEAMSELGVYVKLAGKEITEFCDKLQSGKEYLIVNKDTNIGIFNEWSGTCGYPDNYLEKDFIVPINMIRNVQIEGASKNTLYGYTINDVCGMMGDFWNSHALSYTDEAPELVEEDFTAVIKEYTDLIEGGAA